MSNQFIQSPQQNNIQQLINIMKSSSNPQAMIQKMISTNPKMQSIINMMQQSGQTPKQFFYQYAQQIGVDPNQVLNMFR